MNNKLINSVLTALGIVSVTVLLVKVFKYFFQKGIVLVSIIIILKMIISNWMSYKELQYKHESERELKSIKLQAELQLQRDVEQQKAQQYYQQQNFLYEEKQKKETLELRQQAFSEVEKKINQFNEETFKEINKMKKLYTEYERLCDKTQDVSEKALIRIKMLWLDRDIKQQQPPLEFVSKQQEIIKHNVLVVYGLIKDSTLQQPQTFEEKKLELFRESDSLYNDGIKVIMSGPPTINRYNNFGRNRRF